MWWHAPPAADHRALPAVRDMHGKEMIWVFLFREEVMFKVNKAASTVLKKGSAVLGISFVTLSAASAIPVTCQCSE